MKRYLNITPQKELTCIFDAQVTIICNGEEDQVLSEPEIAKEVKEMLGADDVVVKNLKIFVSKEGSHE